MKRHEPKQPSKPSGDPEVLFVPCRICGEQVKTVVPHEDNFLRPHIERLTKYAAHDHCVDQSHAKSVAARVLHEDEARYSSWETLCPAEYQKTIDPKAKGYHGGRFERVLAWRFGDIGLQLRGPSSLCKTRFAYQLLYREHLAGRKVAAYMHADFRRTVTALAGAGGSELARFVLKLLKVEILMLDDLGKGKPTPTADESLFSLVDGRNRECLPTIYTFNGTLEGLSQNITLEYRDPLIARIRAKTTEIVFA